MTPHRYQNLYHEPASGRFCIFPQGPAILLPLVLLLGAVLCNLLMFSDLLLLPRSNAQLPRDFVCWERGDVSHHTSILFSTTTHNWSSRECYQLRLVRTDVWKNDAGDESNMQFWSAIVAMVGAILGGLSLATVLASSCFAMTLPRYTIAWQITSALCCFFPVFFVVTGTGWEDCTRHDAGIRLGDGALAAMFGGFCYVAAAAALHHFCAVMSLECLLPQPDEWLFTIPEGDEDDLIQDEKDSCHYFLYDDAENPLHLQERVASQP